MVVSNVDVYGLERSIRESKYPMSVNPAECTEELTDRQIKLANAHKGSGHDNFLNGCIVQFDLTFSNKAWVELQRYHFIDFVSSQSTMHCISKMDIKCMCNDYVSDVVIAEVERLKEIYLKTKDREDYLRLLYNIPSGFELTARMTTNYRQLKTVYKQRRNHRLPDWHIFCDFIEKLPYSELITGKDE